jgi:hypothetical protein
MSDERLLFDRKLLRARRARFASEIETHTLLLAYVAREIAERVELMLRPFPLATSAPIMDCSAATWRSSHRSAR